MPVTTTELDPSGEAALLAAARLGDEDAFAALVGPRRAELHAHCYRMLASVDDADDALQDTLVKAWKGLRTFEARSSLRTWLFRIATHVAIDASARRARRELPVEVERVADGAEVAWLGPYPDYLVQAQRSEPEARYAAKESLEVAFVAGLQHLPAPQRAALILRDVLGFTAAETAALTDSTVAAVNSALQRARRHLAERMPERSQQQELTALGADATRALAAEYARAIAEADLDGLLGLLTSDATWSMPPVPEFYTGLAEIGRFQAEGILPDRWQHQVSTASGQLAVGCYVYFRSEGRFLPVALDVLELRDGKIAAVTGFLTEWGLLDEDREAGLRGLVDFERFGLPLRPPENAMS